MNDATAVGPAYRIIQVGGHSDTAKTLRILAHAIDEAGVSEQVEFIHGVFAEDGMCLTAMYADQESARDHWALISMERDLEP